MVVGAAGCSLVAMVARICSQSKKYEGVRPAALRLVEAGDELRERMLQLRERDEAAFGAVVAARGDKDAMQRALAEAAAAPLEGAESALALLQLAREAGELGNANLVSDVGCAAEFGYAALSACIYNVRINHKFMKAPALVEAQSTQIQRLETEAAELLKAIRDTVNAALG